MNDGVTWRQRAGRKEFLAALFPLAGLILAWLILFRPLFANDDFAGGIGDGRFNMFVLEHVYRWLSGAGDSLLSPGIFYPFPYALGFSDTHAGSVLIYAFFRFAGLDQYHAVNAWIAVGYLATFLVSYLALLRLSLRPVLASIGAFAFAYSLPSLSHLDHSQLIYRIGTPLAFLFAYEFVRSKSPDDLLKFIAACSLQLLMNVYTGVYTLLLCGILLLTCGLYFGLTGEGGFSRMWNEARSAWTRAGNYRLATIVTTALLTGLALAVLAFHAYVSHLYELGRDWSEIEYQVARVRSYFVMDNLPYWASISEATQGLRQRNEHQLFLGIPLVVLFVAMLDFLLWRRRYASPQLKVFVLSILAAGVLMTSFRGHTLYWFIAQLPGFNALRAAARYEIILVFPVVVAVGLYLQHLLRLPRLKFLGAAAIAGWALWSVVDVALLKTASDPISVVKARIENMGSAVPGGNAGAVPVLAYGGDPDDDPVLVQFDAMLLAQSLGMPTLNGLSGNAPRGYGLRPTCTGFMRQLAAYDEWAKKHGWPRLSELDYEPDFVRMESCDLSLDAMASKTFSSGDPLTRESAASVRIRPLGIVGNPADYEIRLRIVNGSEQALHALSSSPFRLSWRATEPEEASSEGWDERVEIEGDIGAGEALEQTLLIPRKAVGSGKVIQVNFVVEGKFWAHDIGIPPVEILPPN